MVLSSIGLWLLPGFFQGRYTAIGRLCREKNTMRIAINAQLLSYSENYRNGGISRYIRYLLTALAQQPGKHEYTIFVNGPEVAERLRGERAASGQIEYVPVAWPESRPLSRVMWEQLDRKSVG